MDLDDFIGTTLAEAEQQGHEIAVMQSAETQESVTLSVDELRRALEAEREKY